MVQLGDIIEIGSSPEHTPRPTARRAREKGKGKATPHRLEFASTVIELTDSESEAEGKAPTSYRVGPSPSKLHVGPGPSTPSYPLRHTGSLDDVSTPTQQNGLLASGSGSETEASPKQKLNGHNHKPPLFLPGDDEHGSPAPDIGRVEANFTGTPVIEQEPTVLLPEPQFHRQDPMPTESFDPVENVANENVDPAENVVPIENIDPTSTAVAQILEIIPNVEPDHLLQLIETHLPTYFVFRDNGGPEDNGGEGAAAAVGREATVEEQVQGVVGHVLHLLFENPDYPKADLRAGGKGKGKRVAGPDDEDGLEGKGKGKAKDSSSKKPKIDYASIDRPFPGGPNYFDLALVCLSLP